MEPDGTGPKFLKIGLRPSNNPTVKKAFLSLQSPYLDAPYGKNGSIVKT